MVKDEIGIRLSRNYNHFSNLKVYRDTEKFKYNEKIIFS